MAHFKGNYPGTDFEILRETTVTAATTLAVIYNKYHLNNSDVLTEPSIQWIPGVKRQESAFAVI